MTDRDRDRDRETGMNGREGRVLTYVQSSVETQTDANFSSSVHPLGKAENLTVAPLESSVPARAAAKQRIETTMERGKNLDIVIVRIMLNCSVQCE
jgi:hypothetical protein